MKKLWHAYLKHNEIYAYAQLQQFGYLKQEICTKIEDKQISFDFK